MEARLVHPALRADHAINLLPELDAHTATLLAELERAIATRPHIITAAPRAPPAKRVRRAHAITSGACRLPPPTSTAYMHGQFEAVHDGDVTDGIAHALTNALLRRIAYVPQYTGWPDGTTLQFFGDEISHEKLCTLVHRIVECAQVSTAVHVVALVLLDRARAADGALALCSRNITRAFVAAFAIAGKTIEDEPPRNAALAEAAGLVSVGEINMLERQLLRRLEWRCAVPRHVYIAYRNDVFTEFLVMMVGEDGGTGVDAIAGAL
eukprot:IDg4195t1